MHESRPNCTVFTRKHIHGVCSHKTPGMSMYHFRAREKLWKLREPRNECYYPFSVTNVHLPIFNVQTSTRRAASDAEPDKSCGISYLHRGCLKLSSRLPGGEQLTHPPDGRTLYAARSYKLIQAPTHHAQLRLTSSRISPCGSFQGTLSWCRG